MSVSVREGDAVTKGQELISIDSTDARSEVERMAALVAASQAEVKRATQARIAGEVASQARLKGSLRALDEAKARMVVADAGPRQELIQQARTRVDAAQAMAAQAQRELARSLALFESGVIPRSVLEKSQAQQQTAEAALGESQSHLAMLVAGPTAEERQLSRSQVESANAAVEIAVAGLAEIDVLKSAEAAAIASKNQAVASLELAKDQLEKSRLVSPVAGYVSRVKIEPGMLADPSSPVVEIATREDLHIEAEVGTEDANGVKVGNAVRVYSATLPGRALAGIVEAVSSVAEIKPDAAIRTRIIRARIILASDDLKSWSLLKPGMELDIEGTYETPNTMSVPNRALSVQDTGTFVYVLRDGVAIQTPVTTGLVTSDRTEVLTGVHVGDTVAASGLDELENGSRVRGR